jgi:hypothetical protein
VGGMIYALPLALFTSSCLLNIPKVSKNGRSVKLNQYALSTPRLT